MADAVAQTKQALAPLCGENGALDVVWEGDGPTATASVTVRPLSENDDHKTGVKQRFGALTEVLRGATRVKSIDMHAILEQMNEEDGAYLHIEANDGGPLDELRTAISRSLPPEHALEEVLIEDDCGGCVFRGTEDQCYFDVHVSESERDCVRSSGMYS